MIDTETRESRSATSTQEGFFGNYDWCLNPFLKVEDLLARLGEELHRYRTLRMPWERRESRTNLYIFVCAVSCTVDDYLSWRPLALEPLAKEYSKLRHLIYFAERLSNLPMYLMSLAERQRISRWKISWDESVEFVCGLIAADRELTLDELSDLERRFKTLSADPLSSKLLSWRMRLNDGFRCQDMTHHDVLKMADRYVQARSVDTEGDRVVIIGARTAGAYFAPLIKSHLLSRGIDNISWMTVRPKLGVSPRERKKLRRYLTGNVTVILTDDYSNTGSTFALLQAAVIAFGVSPDRIVLLVPRHPAQAKTILSTSLETKVITLEQSELYMNDSMQTCSAVEVLRELLLASDDDEISIQNNRFVDDMNRKFSHHYPESFQARLKRLFEVRIQHKDGSATIKRILAKGVGWGWLGYHAYIAGTRLQGFVPEIIGLRNGMLFMEWLEGETMSGRKMSDEILDRMSSYLIRRANVLSLNEDPRLVYPFVGWGWLQILGILRRVFGAKVGYLMNRALLEQLSKITRPLPILTDGRMKPDEWIVTDKGLFKVDFEQHNFGAPEFDVVDPAYDIAIASFEFRLTEKEEERIILKYSRESSDKNVDDRMVIYKLLFATIQKNRTLSELFHRKPQSDLENLNQQYILSWNYLVFTMNHFCSGLVKSRSAWETGPNLVFLDLDGVFDSETLGFPHTTTSGLTALVLLKSNGYSVIPDTGRSIEHVRNYCSSYGFDAGIAEYGSVIYDGAKGTEIGLVDNETTEELRRLRELVQCLQGVFVDTTYRYAIRAYRYNAKGTEGLKREEAEYLLKQSGFQRIKIILRQADTYFVGKSIDKGKAMEEYLTRMQYIRDMSVAIGDSDEDIPMLKIAARAFAPKNCSQGIQESVKNREVYNRISISSKGTTVGSRSSSRC